MVQQRQVSLQQKVVLPQLGSAGPCPEPAPTAESRRAAPEGATWISELASAALAAVGACRSHQRAAAKLDASLAQAAVNLDGLLGWQAFAEEAKIHEATPWTQLSGWSAVFEMVPTLAAHIAALQAESLDIAVRLSLLTSAQAEFSIEVDKWARLAPPDVLQYLSPPEDDGRLREASSGVPFGGSLYSLCARHPTAELRGAPSLAPPPPAKPQVAPLRLPATPRPELTSRSPAGWSLSLSKSVTPSVAVSIWKEERQPPHPGAVYAGSDKVTGARAESPPRAPTQQDVARPAEGPLPGALDHNESSKLSEPTSDDKVHSLERQLLVARSHLHHSKAELDHAHAELAILRARALYASHRGVYAAAAGGALTHRARRPRLQEIRPDGSREPPDVIALVSSAAMGTLGRGPHADEEAVQCWAMLRQLGLSPEDRAKVLTSARGVLRMPHIKAALRRFQSRKRPRPQALEDGKSDAGSDLAFSDDSMEGRGQAEERGQAGRSRGGSPAPGRVASPAPDAGGGPSSPPPQLLGELMASPPLLPPERAPIRQGEDTFPVGGAMPKFNRQMSSRASGTDVDMLGAPSMRRQTTGDIDAFGMDAFEMGDMADFGRQVSKRQSPSAASVRGFQRQTSSSMQRTTTGSMMARRPSLAGVVMSPDALDDDVSPTSMQQTPTSAASLVSPTAAARRKTPRGGGFGGVAAAVPDGRRTQPDPFPSAFVRQTSKLQAPDVNEEALQSMREQVRNLSSEVQVLQHKVHTWEERSRESMRRCAFMVPEYVARRLRKQSAAGAGETIGPERWGISVGQLADFRDRIIEELSEYCAEHAVVNMDGCDVHICLSSPCTMDHGAASYMASHEAPPEIIYDALLPTMHVVVAKYVKPVCKSHQNFALSLNPNGREACTFISHCWSEDFNEFVDAMLMALKRDEGVFICAFSMDQTDPHRSFGLFNAESASSPVRLALQHARRFLAVVDRRFLFRSRLWCLWEVYCATQLQKRTVIWPSYMLDLADVQQELSTLACSEAVTTDKAEEQLLVRFIEGTVGLEAMDRILSQFICERIRFYREALTNEDLAARAEFAAEYQAQCEERDDVVRQHLSEFPDGLKTQEHRIRLKTARKQLASMIAQSRTVNMEAHMKADLRARRKELHTGQYLTARFRDLYCGLLQLGEISEKDAEEGKLHFHHLLDFRARITEFTALTEQYLRESLSLTGMLLAPQERNVAQLEASEPGEEEKEEGGGDEEAPEVKPLSAKEAAEAAFVEAGGYDVVEAHFHSLNSSIRTLRLVRGSAMGSRQDCGYELLSIDRLYEIARARRNKFLHEANALARMAGALLEVRPLKSRNRATSKVTSEYGNDRSCLNGLLRAGLVFDELETLFSGAKAIINWDLQTFRHDVLVVEVQDRFAMNSPGSILHDSVVIYIKVDGFVCKLTLKVKSLRNAVRSAKDAVRTASAAGDALLLVCAQNEIAVAKDLINRYPGCCSEPTLDRHLRAPLHYSCQVGSAPMVRLLLDGNASPWVTDCARRLPVEFAMIGEHFDIADLVLGKMLKTKVPTSNPIARLANFVLPWLCDYADHLRIEAAPAQTPAGSIQEEATEEQRSELEVSSVATDELTTEDNEGGGAKPDDGLLKQIESVGRKLVQLIKRNKAMSNLDDVFGDAASHSRLGRLRWLIRFRVDLELEFLQKSPLDLAIEAGHEEVCRILLSEKFLKCARCNSVQPNEHLKLAAMKEDAKYARAAILVGADPKSVTASMAGKRTALMAFAAAGDQEMVEALAAHPRMVERKDEFGATAIDYAHSLGHHHVAIYLDELAPVPEEGDHAGDDTPSRMTDATFQDAILKGCCSAVWALSSEHQMAGVIGSGVMFDQSGNPRLSKQMNENGETPLHLALSKACLDNDPAGQVCRSLLYLKANPTKEDALRNTPLHKAATSLNSALYREVFAAVADWLGSEESATTLATTAANKKGQVAASLAETNKVFSEGIQGKPFKAKSMLAMTGVRLLLKAAFIAFRHQWMASQLDTWRFKQASSFRDLLGLSGGPGRNEQRVRRMVSLRDRVQNVSCEVDPDDLPVTSARTAPTPGTKRRSGERHRGPAAPKSRASAAPLRRGPTGVFGNSSLMAPPPQQVRASTGDNLLQDMEVGSRRPHSKPEPGPRTVGQRPAIPQGPLGAGSGAPQTRRRASLPHIGA